MFSIDTTIVAVALPNMVADLHSSLALIGWTLTAYTLTQTAVMPLVGKLSESYGRMRVFLGCVLLFTLGSLLCGLAPNIYLLILFRVLQALGGGGFIPSAVGIVAREFPEQRGRMIGLFTSIFPVGGIIGPNLGGLIIEYASWRDVFLVNVPIGAVVLLVLLRRARSDREATVQHRVDVIGTLLFAGGIVALLSAITLLGNDVTYWRSAEFWALLAASAALLATFVWHERRTPEPVLDLGLVTRNPFLAVNVYNFLFGAAVFGFFSFIPYYAVVQFGMAPAESGAILTPRSLMMMVAATLSSFFLLRLGYRAPMLLGMVLIAASLLLLSRGWAALDLGGAQVGTFWLVAAQVALGGLGMGLAAPASNNAALDLMPDRAAVITGIRGMFRSTGAVLGVALIVLALEFSPDKAAGLRTIFVALAAVLLAAIPLVFLIPDTARDRRLAQQREAAAARAGSEPVAGPAVAPEH
jgi:EmrB/QacA subfamily drug resistance transporter